MFPVTAPTSSMGNPKRNKITASSWALQSQSPLPVPPATSSFPPSSASLPHLSLSAAIRIPLILLSCKIIVGCGGDNCFPTILFHLNAKIQKLWPIKEVLSDRKFSQKESWETCHLPFPFYLTSYIEQELKSTITPDMFTIKSVFMYFSLGAYKWNNIIKAQRALQRFK